MKRKSCLFLFIIFWLAGYPEDTVRIKNLGQFKRGKVNILVSPTGRETIVNVLDRSQGWAEEEPQLDPRPSEDGLRSVRLPGKRYVDPKLTDKQKKQIRQNECINNRFAGLSRGKVKTGLSQGRSTTYNSLDKLINTLPADEDMRMVVAVLKRPWSQRAIQEDKRINLTNVFLYAYSREKDNDYHLILTNADRTIFFNAEISGLPDRHAPSYQALKAVRTTFDNYPGPLGCGRYSFLQIPLRIISLKGPLFFDAGHVAGQVGPDGARPKTAWEIHPVTSIKFE